MYVEVSSTSYVWPEDYHIVENLAGIKFSDFGQSTVFWIWRILNLQFDPPTEILHDHHKIEPCCLMAACHLKSWEKCPAVLARSFSAPYLHTSLSSPPVCTRCTALDFKVRPPAAFEHVGPWFRVCLTLSLATWISFRERRIPDITFLGSVHRYHSWSTVVSQCHGV